MRRDLKHVAAAGLILSVLIVAHWWRGPLPVYVSILHPQNRGEQMTMTGSGDGQVILMLAQGKHPPPGADLNSEGYRWLRPLPIVLTYLTALGQKARMAYAMMVWSIIGAALLVLVAAQLLTDVGRSPWWALLVLLAPGLWSGLAWFSPDPLGVALALWGWRTNNRALMALGALQHEVLLIFALARKKLFPVVVFGVWLVVVSIVWGYHPEHSNVGLFGFLTIKDGVGIRYFSETVLLAIAAALTKRFRWPALGFVGVMMFLGPLVMFYWMNFSRILIAVWVMGLIGLFEHRHALAAKVLGVRAPHRADRDEDLNGVSAHRAPIERSLDWH